MYICSFGKNMHGVKHFCLLSALGQHPLLRLVMTTTSSIESHNARFLLSTMIAFAHKSPHDDKEPLGTMTQFFELHEHVFDFWFGNFLYTHLAGAAHSLGQSLHGGRHLRLLCLKTSQRHLGGVIGYGLRKSPCCLLRGGQCA